MKKDETEVCEFFVSGRIDDDGLNLTKSIGDLMEMLRLERSRKAVSLEQALARVSPIIEEMRLMIGGEVAGIVNQHAGEAVGNLHQKRVVAKALNDLLDGIGLRIKCPSTGKGAAIVALPCGNSIGDGRFQLRTGGNPRSTTSTNEIPKLKLILRNMNEKPRGYGARSELPGR